MCNVVSFLHLVDVKIFLNVKPRPLLFPKQIRPNCSANMTDQCQFVKTFLYDIMMINIA